MQRPTRRHAQAMILAALVVPASGGLMAQEAPALSTVPMVISAGEGKVRLPPSRARLSLAVSARGSSAAAASREADARTGRVLTALRAMERVDSARVLRVHVSANENQNRRIVDFESTAWIEAVVRDLPRLGSVLDTALAAGATSINDVQFEADSLDAGRRRALAEAFKSASLDAAALAAATGGSLGELMSVSSSMDGGPRPMPFGVQYSRNAGMGEAMMNAAPAPQSIEVSASVTAQWRLERP